MHNPVGLTVGAAVGASVGAGDEVSSHSHPHPQPQDQEDSFEEGNFRLKFFEDDNFRFLHRRR